MSDAEQRETGGGGGRMGQETDPEGVGFEFRHAEPRTSGPGPLDSRTVSPGPDISRPSAPEGFEFETATVTRWKRIREGREAREGARHALMSAVPRRADGCRPPRPRRRGVRWVHNPLSLQSRTVLSPKFRSDGWETAGRTERLAKKGSWSTVTAPARTPVAYTRLHGAGRESTCPASVS